MTGPSMVEPATAVLSLAPDAQAPGRARRFLAEELAGPDLQAISEVGQLLVSELVTNAVVHAASAVEVELVREEAGGRAPGRGAHTMAPGGRAAGGAELAA